MSTVIIYYNGFIYGPSIRQMTILSILRSIRICYENELATYVEICAEAHIYFNNETKQIEPK